MSPRIENVVLRAVMTSILAVTVVGCGKAVDSAGMALPSTSVGTEIDDSVITSSVKAALLADANIKSFDFKVETRKGEVLLSGFVDNQAQLDRATSAAHAVSGVKAVQNNVILKVALTTIGNKLDGGIITGKVKAALLGDAKVKSFDIAVVTRKDEVLLTGFVDSREQMDRAIEIARGIEGVHSVSNEMSIKK